MLNLAAIHEAVAAAVPRRECLVFRTRRLSWADVTDRTRRLASVLRERGLGCHEERERLQRWESGQDHVALYLHNGNEYLEGMLGAFKARCAPFNVNYRYIDDELLHLLDDADARAVLFQARFAPTLARLREKLPKLRVWLQVDDGSGEPLLPGALDYEQALADAAPQPPTDLSPDDLYVLYTGGTTGLPKGVLWRQEDIFRAALRGPSTPDTLEGIAARARIRELRALPAPPFMHGAAHWVALNVWIAGGTVVVQSEPGRLDPHDIWSTVERERVNLLTIVGDAFARPLLDQLRERDYDLSSLTLISSGGAILTAMLKGELLRRLPGVRLLDALGSSESGTQASQLTASSHRASSGDFLLSASNVVLREDLSGLVEPGSGEEGWLAREGHIPLGYYKDPKKTARTFPEIQGRRYALPGDRARVEADGGLRLLGRDSVTINTGGEKVYAEEVEHALKHHPSVYDAVAVGTPHPRWGQQITALVRLRSGARVDEEELLATARRHVASYKVPKAIVFVEELVRAPSGKADYRWARARALQALGLGA
jgi:fatty-acyl-CoA synthase